MNDQPTPGLTPAQIRDLMPFAVLLGIELLDAGRELVRARLHWTPEHCTTGGLMHGGAITASTRPLHAGRTLIVVETEVAREDGALAAKVAQTQAFHYPRA